MKIRKTVIIFFILIVSIGCDQLTKIKAQEHLSGSPQISFMSDFFVLQFAENRGAMLGIGKNLPEKYRFLILTVSVGFLLFGGLLYLLVKVDTINKFEITAYSLILSGGISNFYDRAMNKGAVIDFMNMGIGPVRTGIFNFADVAIMAGAGLLIFYQLKNMSDNNKREIL